MESNEQKLEAIRAQARRAAAEKAQADAAASRAAEREERRNPEKYRFTAGHFAMAMFAIIALSWTYMSKEPEKPNDFHEKLDALTEKVIAARLGAFNLAAIRQLQRRGALTVETNEMEVRRLSGELYLAEFRYNGQRYELRGEYICSQDGLLQEARKDPACYRWH